MRSFRTAAVLLLTTGLATAAFAQVKLELKHPAGKSTTTSTIKVNQTLTIAGMERPTSNETVTVESAVTTPPKEDGTFRVEQKTESIKVRSSLAPGLGVEFDSAKPDAAKVDNPMLQPLLDLYKAISGASYTVVFDKDSNVKTVDGLDKLIAEAGPAADLLRQEMSVERIRKEVTEGLARLPENPVKPSDKWQRVETMNVGSGQIFTFTTYYEYQGTEEKEGKTFDKIGFTYGDVKLAVEDNAGAAKVINSDLKIENSSGLLRIDRSLGAIAETSSMVRIVGPMTISVNNMEIPAKLDLTMERTSVVKR